MNRDRQRETETDTRTRGGQRPPLSEVRELGAPDPARQHFHALAAEQQHEAIARLAAAGHGDHRIAHATGLSVEMIRRVLAERAQRARG